MTALLRFFNDIVAKYLRQDRELTHDIDVRNIDEFAIYTQKYKSYYE